MCTNGRGPSSMSMVRAFHLSWHGLQNSALFLLFARNGTEWLQPAHVRPPSMHGSSISLAVSSAHTLLLIFQQPSIDMPLHIPCAMQYLECGV
jgi:hypothetical protein